MLLMISAWQTSSSRATSAPSPSVSRPSEARAELPIWLVTLVVSVLSSGLRRATGTWSPTVSYNVQIHPSFNDSNSYPDTPVFFLRDPAKFPHFIHTQKRHPQTHLTHSDDSTVFWDYLSQNPESVHQVMILMGDRGIPDSWRKMHGYAGHTLKLVNKNGDWVYGQMHMKSKQGTSFVTQADSANYSPDYSQKDLYDAIERKD